MRVIPLWLSAAIISLLLAVIVFQWRALGRLKDPERRQRLSDRYAGGSKALKDLEELIEEQLIVARTEIEDRISDLERKMDQIVDHISRQLSLLELDLSANGQHLRRPPRKRPVGIGEVARLARAGLGPDEIASRLGVGRGEAELMLQLLKAGAGEPTDPVSGAGQKRANPANPIDIA